MRANSPWVETSINSMAYPVVSVNYHPDAKLCMHKHSGMLPIPVCKNIGLL